ncbi:MAG TPA: hypothetical protein QGF95_03285 [Candidatus Latescibacteria bacterium]|jgi:hypothetical protein|nr:hypothetical protein [Gemmatimonadaceae bacterium]MDP6019063.1 hypothetical protein [Candidatus Latescibacterota bacterium]HJP29560.1 hypothetical protein [Candidatus Latescibacterota bacterium]
MTHLSFPTRWASIGLAAALLAGTAEAQIRTITNGQDILAPVALAVPVEGIRIDGDLSDWPEGVQRIPMRNHFQAYGPTDLDDVDLSASDDFSPSMMVGYDDDEDMLYVAVVARDDELFMDGSNDIYRDGIEVYVSGLADGSSPYQ